MVGYRQTVNDAEAASHLGVLVEVHARFRGDVLGADDLTVSLKGL